MPQNESSLVHPHACAMALLCAFGVYPSSLATLWLLQYLGTPQQSTRAWPKHLPEFEHASIAAAPCGCIPCDNAIVYYFWQIKSLSRDKLARSLGEELDEQSQEDSGFYLGAGLQSLWDEMAVRMGTWKAGKEQEEEEDEVMEGGPPPVQQDKGGYNVGQVC